MNRRDLIVTSRLDPQAAPPRGSLGAYNRRNDPMKERLPLLSLRTFLAILAIFLSPVAWAQSPPPPPEISSAQAERDVPADHTKSPATPKVCVACIRAEMNFLASDALRGRGSGTRTNCWPPPTSPRNSNSMASRPPATTEPISRRQPSCAKRCPPRCSCAS